MTMKKSMGKAPQTEEEKAAAAAAFGAAAGTPPELTHEVIAKPSKDDKEKRKQRFNLMLTDTEHEELKAAAELADRSQHAFTRIVVLAEARRMLAENGD